VAYVAILEEYRFYVREDHAISGNATSDLTPVLSRARFYPGTDQPYAADNANLKRELLAHNLPLPGGGRPDVSGREELQLPSDAEFNRMMTFMEKVWKRMVEMIVTTQKDIMKKP